MASPFLTLGNGELHFAAFATGTQNPKGERYLGESNGFSVNVTSDRLTHKGGDRGVKSKDLSVNLGAEYSSQIVTEEISPDNVAMAFLGTTATVTNTSQTVTDESIAGVEQGLSYQLGLTPTNPVGAFPLDVHTAPTTNVIVKVGAATKAEGTDYTVDLNKGRVTIVKGGSIVDGSTILVSYKTKAASRSRTVSGNTEKEGVLRYIEYNAHGPNKVWVFPWVAISMDGDLELKSEDNFTEMTLNVDIRKKGSLEAIYCDGQPVTA